MKQFLRHIFLLVAMFVATASLTAQTYNGGTWYSLYETKEYAVINVVNNYNKDFDIFSPAGGKLSFEAHKATLGWGDLFIEQYVSSSWISVDDFSLDNKYKTYTTSSNINASATKIRFKVKDGSSLNRTFRNVKLPLAKHILLESGTFGTSSITITDGNLATAEGYTSTNKYQVKLRSFLASGNIKMTSSNPEFHFGGGVTEVYLGVANNYCASANGSGSCTNASTLGHISSYYKDVYFSPSVQYNTNARSTTITITDGVNTAYVYLTAPVIPTYYFKAEAIAEPTTGGMATAKFANGASTYSLVAPNVGTNSMSAEVTFEAAATGNSVFEGWKEPSKDVYYKQGAATYRFVETITSSVLDPRNMASQKTYRAIFSERFTAKITGSNYTGKLVNKSWPADYQFVNTQTAKPTNSEADPFYFKIEHNFTGNDTREGSPRPDEVIAYDPSTNKITALNEGTATITFYQKNTSSHEPVTESFTVQVVKHTPVFTLNPAVTNSPEKLYFNKEYPNYFTTTANSPLTITSSDELVAKWVQGSNAQSYTLKTFSKTNTATLTAIQHENYYWERLEGSIDIQLQNPNNHVPFTVTENNDNEVFVKHSYYGYQWNNGLQVGDGGGGGNWNAKYVIIEFSGVPDKLTFDYVTRGVIFDNTTWHDGIFWFVQESATNEGEFDGSGKNTFWDNKEYIWSTTSGDNDSSPAIQLSPETRFIRIGYWGNFGTAFQNVHVSKREEFYASEVDTKNEIDTLNFDIDPNGDPKENQVGIPHSLSFDFHYASVGYDVKLSTNDPDHFTISKTSLKNIGGEKVGKETITVTYLASEKYTAENKELYITDELGHKYIIALTASTVNAQTLDWEAPAQIDACGQLLLPNETDQHIALDWTVVAGQQYADFEDGMLAIKGNGIITLRASNNGSENYNAFQKDYQIKIVYNPIFLGTEDNDWNNPNNWNICHLPSETDVVTMQASAVLEEHVTVRGLIFNDGGSIEILSTGGLAVGVNGITGAKEDGSSIIIDNTPEGAGFLRVDPTTANKPAKVTINYTTQAFNSGNPRDEVWQYMGAPGSDMQMSDAHNTMIYHWNEQQGWLKMSNTDLQPFVGYAFTQNKADTASFQIQATPIIPKDIQEINLTVTPTGMGGSNLFVNSFLAPIDLAKFDGTEFEGKVDKTFYLFNSGSWKDWQSQGGKDHMEYGTSPGQYFALTPGSAALVDASLDQTTIPSMQGVYVIARENGAKIKLDYAKHVYAANASNTPMRAPQRISEDFKRVRLQVNSQNSGADRMYVIQHEVGTTGYDNGYDARNMAVASQVSIYTHEADGQMEISVSDKIDSTYIGFRAGSDSEYTLRMTSVVGEEMYLKDLVDNILIPIVDGQDYTFAATPNSVNDTRFLLLGQKSGVATDIEEVRVYIHNNIVHVMEAPENSKMSIYTVGGVAIANYSIGYAPCTIDILGLSTGVYVLRINDQVYKFVCK